MHPPPPTHPGIAWIRRYAVVTPGWAELYSHSPTWEDFFARIRQYPVDQVLFHLSQVNAVLARHDGIEGQAGLCHDLFYPNGNEVWTRFERFAKDLSRRGAHRPPCLFHPAQVLMAAKLALTSHGPVIASETQSMRPLGEALLMLSDLLRPEDAAPLESILSRMMASHLFTFSDISLNALGRSFELYMSDHSDLHTHDSYINLPNELERITGLPPVLLWLMLFVACGALSSRPLSEYGKPFNLGHFLHTPQGDAGVDSEQPFTKQEVDRVVELLVATVSQVSEEIKEQNFSHTTALLHDVSDFAVHPLIRHDGKDLCMSENFLFKKITNGMHHIFLHPDHTTKKSRDRYLRFTGPMFERYADRVLRRCFADQEGIYSGLLPSRGESCCDALWRCGDALVLFEFKAGQLDRAARAGSVERFKAKLEQLVFKPAHQMDSTIRLFKSGQLPVGGANPERVWRFFPVSVVLEPLTMAPVLHEQLLDAIKDRGLLQEQGVRPLQIINVAELELLEVGLSRGLKLLHVLAKKLDMPEWMGAGFHNFFRHQYPDRFIDTKNSHLVSIAENAKEQAYALLRERLGVL